MIHKFRFGNPLNTEAVVENYPIEEKIKQNPQV